MRVEIAIALVCSAVTMLGVVYLGAQFFHSPPPPSPPQAKGIVWGGRTFVDLAQFSRWLRSQGVAYEVWALRHPTRAGIAPLGPPTVPEAERAQPSGAGHRSTWTTVAGVAVILAALAILLGIRRRSWLPRMRGELTSERLDVAAQGVAAGAQTMLRLAIVGARRSSRLGASVALALVAAARAVAAAAAAGARLILRVVLATARALSSWAGSVTFAVWRRRGELAWYVAGALFATMSALALTAWA